MTTEETPNLPILTRAGQLVDPETGAILELTETDLADLAQLVETARAWKQTLDGIVLVVSEEIVRRADFKGTRTLHAPGWQIKVPADTETVVPDPVGLRNRLLALADEKPWLFDRDLIDAAIYQKPGPWETSKRALTALSRTCAEVAQIVAEAQLERPTPTRRASVIPKAGGIVDA